MAGPLTFLSGQEIDQAENTTNWNQINFAGGGGGALDFGPDLSFQGTNCVLRQVSNNDRGMYFNNGSTFGGTLTDQHFMVWLITGNPGLTDTLQNAGAAVLVGVGTDVVRFHVEGNDTFGAAGRVAKCYAVRYVTTAKATPPNYRTIPNATPSGSVTSVGGSNKILQTTKGLNLGVDVIRLIRSFNYAFGELISAGDASDNPASFIKINNWNDPVSARYGMFTKVGNNYEWQGYFKLGWSGEVSKSYIRFRDSDISIDVVDAFHADPNWTRMEIFDNGTGSRVEWTNISFKALGVTTKGRIVMIDPFDFIWTTGFNVGFGDIVLLSGAVFTELSFTNCEQIDASGGGTLNSCKFINSTTAQSVIAADLNQVNNCEFTSDGSNHAVELTSIGSGTMTWTGKLTGYDAGVAGSPVTPTSTGNEAIYVNVGAGTLTINVAEGADIPSIRSAGATVNVVAGQRTFTFTLNPSITNYEWRIYEVSAIGSLGGAVEVAGQESATQDNQAYNYSFTAPQAIAVQIISQPNNDFVEAIEYFTLGDANQSVTINLQTDNNN